MPTDKPGFSAFLLLIYSLQVFDESFISKQKATGKSIMLSTIIYMFDSDKNSGANIRMYAKKLFAECAIIHGHIEFVKTLITPSNTPRKNITMNVSGEKCNIAKASDDIAIFIIIPYFFR